MSAVTAWSKSVTFFGPHSRSQSVEDVGGKDSDAENEKSGCDCFKHGASYNMGQSQNASSANRASSWRLALARVDVISRFGSERRTLDSSACRRRPVSPDHADDHDDEECKHDALDDGKR